jgi:LPXTG-site transpeptidase (sortase) family protein
MTEREARPRHWFNRRRGIGLALIVIGLALLGYPFFPWARYAILRPAPSVPYTTKLAGTSYLPVAGPREPTKPEGNRLVIPKIGVDMPIVEGPTETALWRGVWRIPGTSTPDKGGNTVLSGHRFQYRPPNTSTLYLLDRLENGDAIIVYWNDEEYDYIVRDRRVVEPDAVEILAPTETAQLIVFTCTPLFTTKQRLVLIAEPV